MAHIVSHHTVVRDGWHNMCSDLCFWNDTFWLVYDRTSAHSAPDGVVVLMRSADLRRWDEVAVFKTPHDARDAKLAATDDELFVFCADSHYETINGKVRQVAHSYVSVSSRKSISKRILLVSPRLSPGSSGTFSRMSPAGSPIGLGAQLLRTYAAVRSS